jgi:hypothetical protein
MADNPFKNLGLEYMNWRSAPSAGPLLGLLMAGGSDEEQAQEPPTQALGTGIVPPSIPGGVGINAAKPSTVGIAPNQFQLPNLTLPKLGASMAQAPGVDADGDGQIDNFWGVKKPL